jgi:hypothetical protein
MNPHASSTVFSAAGMQGLLYHKIFISEKFGDLEAEDEIGGPIHPEGMTSFSRSPDN